MALILPPGVLPIILLNPYYTMHFPYVALAIKLNANEMYMQMILPILHFVF